MGCFFWAAAGLSQVGPRLPSGLAAGCGGSQGRLLAARHLPLSPLRAYLVQSLPQCSLSPPFSRFRFLYVHRLFCHTPTTLRLRFCRNKIPACPFIYRLSGVAMYSFSLRLQLKRSRVGGVRILMLWGRVKYRKLKSMVFFLVYCRIFNP